ncbi:hypothetical protein FIM08_00225 [SAR202 cluster bacterium AC-647-N09_OGT_505m]|nr:hypothetical protein [SAR202 cluster bacterium AC-647-N09_OGT_505m]
MLGDNTSPSWPIRVRVRSRGEWRGGMDHNFDSGRRSIMKLVRSIILGISLVGAIFAVACSGAEPTATSVPTATPVPTATSTPVPPPTAKILTFSNDSPHVTVIDAETNLVTKTGDIPDFLKWTWNDDNNYFDGQNVWLGLKYPEADDAVVISLDVDTLEVASRISVGKEPKNIYIGKNNENGNLLIGKQGTTSIVTVDTKTSTVVDTWENLPVNKDGGVVCDADVVTGPDGVERFYYPTLAGDSVVSVNAATGEVLAETTTPDGAKPVMHTNAPDGNMWVQEIGSNTNAVFDAVTLELIARFPSAGKPVVATFSPDGKLAYIGHSGDPIVQVVDTETLKEVKQITVGNTPSKIAVHPNGDYIYAIASKEARISVIETGSWKVTGSIKLENNPGGMFLWED